jgi:hypothetical protein
LITASVAVILFVVNFFVDNLRSHGRFTATSLERALVICSALAGLATAGFALLSLRLEHSSHELHLGYRYQRKTLQSLTPEQRGHWDQLARRASRYQKGAFVMLFGELLLAVAFFIAFFW